MAVYLDVVSGGTKLVTDGHALSVVLEEELDAASQVTLQLWPTAANQAMVDGFDFGDALTVELGEDGAPKRTVECTIVDLEHRFDPESGWVLVIRALDALVKLKHTWSTKVWEGSPKTVVEGIAGELGWSAQVQGVSTTAGVWLQNNKSHAEMLRLLGGKLRYVMTLDGTTFRYGRKVDTTTATVDIDDGVTDARVRRSVLDIPTKVTVRGYDWKTNGATVQYSDTGTALAKTSGGTAAPACVQQTFGTVEEIADTDFTLTAADAQTVAEAIFQDRADRFVEGEVECFGKPDARPGRLLSLTNFNHITGTYRIRATRHMHQGMQYRTHITFFSDSKPTA